VFLKRWSARKLFMSWAIYWVALLAVAAWRPLLELIQLRRTQEHGTVSFTYTGSFLSLALWIAGPPLVLFLVWLFTRSRADAPEREREPDRV
jgi:hypothetical protein